jgi:hypothetical protein
MNSFLLRNPFFLREWWVWQREMPRWQLQGTRLLFFLLMLAPFVVICFAALLFGTFSFGTLKFAWGMAAFLWLGGLSWFSVSSTIQVYHYERDLGTLQIASLTRVHPFQEVLGRWAGALVCVFEGWIMGLLLLLFSIFLVPELFLNIACAWIFAAFWCAAIGAIGMVCSAAFRNVLQSFIGVLSTLFITTIIGIAASTMIVLVFTVRHPNDNLIAWCFSLPPDPLAFSLLFKGLLAPAALLVLTFPWALFTLLVLVCAALFVVRGFPLRGESSRHPGPRGIIPVSASAPAFVDQGGSRAILSPIRPASLAAAAQKSPKASFFQRTFGRNPFYAAYRSGFSRIYGGVTASPGSLLPLAIMICGQLCFCLLSFEEDSKTASLSLVYALMLASSISAIEAILLGNRALHAERDQSTWPMLLATGMRPGQVLWGKFMMSFYALSGEWTYAVPFWILLCGQKAGVLVLALIHPAVIGLGIITGLWMASQPRFLILDPRRIPRVVVPILIAWLVAYVFIDDLPGILRALLKDWSDFFNPYAAALALGQYKTSEQLISIFIRLLCQAALFAGIMAVVWKSAEERLNRVMQGE